MLEFRQKQEKAIIVLSYYLCEGDIQNIPGRLLDEIFQTTFGHALYYTQNSLWPYIKTRSTFFINVVKNNMKEALTMENGYAKRDPFFLLLRWDFSPDKRSRGETILRETAKFQHKSWIESDPEISLDSLVNILNEDITVLNKDNFAEEDLSWIYNLNLIFYTLSNIRQRENQKLMDQFQQMMKEKNQRDKLVQALILCDYATRSVSKPYNTLSERNSSKMYLLCAAFRFVCSFQLEQVEIQLSAEQKEKYRTWFVSEKGRFKCLMYRLLSYTDFFKDTPIPDLTDDYCMCYFLPYDRVPEQYDDFIYNPRRLAL